jgi:protease IV
MNDGRSTWRKSLPALLAAGCSLTGSLGRAEAPTTAPDTGAATKSVAVPTTNPATGPTTTPAAKAKFPTPGELIAKMKAAKEAASSKIQVAYIDLSANFSERPAAGLSLFGGGSTQTFRGLIERVQKARDDKDIRAVLFTMTNGIGLNLAQVQELRTEFDALRKADKRVFTYADTYDTRSYLLASAATDVCMLEAGEIFMPGIGIESMFYKGVLDKVGVKADYVQIGEYKGAEEPYTRTEPSVELKAEMEKLTAGLMSQVVDGISGGRNLSSDKVRHLMDDAMLNAQRCQREGLVDHLLDLDGLRDLLKDELGDDVELQANYAGPKQDDIDFSNPFVLLTKMAERPKETDLPKIAVVYAQGVITDGEGGGGGLPIPGLGGDEGGIASEPYRRALRMALRDDKVKAVVIRIDSPGGSAMASEVLWQSIRRLSAEKPVIISIGGMAASGGYYLSSAGDYIFADPAAIVGSIGVVGGKMVLGGLYEKVGLTTTSFTQGKNANIYSSTSEWTDQQRRMIRTWMKSTYDQFTDRILTTRKDKILDIDKVARGRIFTAAEARALGMVDELGGLDAAIAEAAEWAELEKGGYDLKTLPPAPTLQELLGGGGFSMVAPHMTSDAAAVLGMLPADVRQALSQSIQMGQLMQRRPVVLMMPYVISVK